MTRTAFVFGGGGKWGAVEVGMTAALVAAGIRPDLIVGTSIGALNGAMTAADPSAAGVARLRQAWESVEESGILSTRAASRLRTLARQRIAVHTTDELRQLVVDVLPTDRFEDLAVPFQCVAASIERASEQWFDSGSLSDAVLASAAVPMLFPPVVIDGEAYYDGGLVNSVPVDRAVELGATRIFVLQVGRVEQPLRPPARSYEPALIAFEIARRHRFSRALETIDESIELHLLPSGNPMDFDDRRQLRWRDTAGTADLIDVAHRAAADYLDRLQE